ncbi:MAG: hypothetical protein ACRDTU_23060 [Micromonosporaceae bacterium]
MELFAPTFFEKWDFEGEPYEPPEPGDDGQSWCAARGNLRMGSATFGYVDVYFDRMGSDHKSPREHAKDFGEVRLDRICGGEKVDFESIAGRFDFAASCVPRGRQMKAGVALVQGPDVVGVRVDIRDTDASATDARRFAVRSAEIIARTCFTLMSRR